MPTDREIRELEERYRRRYGKEPAGVFEKIGRAGKALWRGAGWVSKRTPLGFGVDQLVGQHYRQKERRAGIGEPISQVTLQSALNKRKAEIDAYRDYLNKAKRRGMVSVVSLPQFIKNPILALEGIENYRKPSISQLYAKEQVAKEAAGPRETLQPPRDTGAIRPVKGVSAFAPFEQRYPGMREQLGQERERVSSENRAHALEDYIQRVMVSKEVAPEEWQAPKDAPMVIPPVRGRPLTQADEAELTRRQARWERS